MERLDPVNPTTIARSVSEARRDWDALEHAFVDEYREALAAMKKSADTLLELMALDPRYRQSLDKIHKKMLQVRRDYANIEHAWEIPYGAGYKPPSTILAEQEKS